jgi:hypothetical protein
MLMKLIIMIKTGKKSYLTIRDLRYQRSISITLVVIKDRIKNINQKLGDLASLR